MKLLPLALMVAVVFFCNSFRERAGNTSTPAPTTESTPFEPDAKNPSIPVEPSVVPTVKPPPGAINGGVLNKKAKSLPQPSYPAAAKAVHASGEVVVQILLDQNGKVVNALALSGHPLLRLAAEQAARNAEFSAWRLGGQPVKVSGVIIYSFNP